MEYDVWEIIIWFIMKYDVIIKEAPIKLILMIKERKCLAVSISSASVYSKSLSEI